MKVIYCFALLSLAIAIAAAPACANVYASGLNKTAANAFSYTLNEDASTGVTVQIWEKGGGMVYSEDMGTQSKGSHSWAWNGSGYQAGKTYTAKVVASATGYSSWTQISTDNSSTSFWSPLGVSVNTHQNSANFGKIYISNASTGTTSFGRACQDGIYMLGADGSDQGFATGGVNWAAKGTSSPFKSTIGADNHLYVSDFSNDLVYEFNDDMSVATQLIDGSNKTADQFVESIYVEGTQAEGNRKIYLVNSNYSDAARKGLIMYDLGGNASATANDTGTQYIGPDYFAFYPRDVARDSEGNWYMCQYRSDATQASAISMFQNNPDGLPINSALWETEKAAPYNGAYGIDIYEPYGWVAYGNYYDGWVRIFDMQTGAYVTGFDAGTRLREVAFDAAGNIVTVDNSTEWAKIWSPGGGVNSFSTDSWFTLTSSTVPEPSSLVALVAALPGLALIRRKR